jgi:regulation of enolase protein 1 (concanavalin A-like superfamily)
LAADVATTNAPRVLQPVTGDFTLQAQVDGRFTPGEQSSLPGRGGYNGAGLVALVDDQNVVTLARAVLHHAGSEPQAYANFEIRINGHVERLGNVADQPIPHSGPLFLRLELRGRKIHGSVSRDGSKWSNLESKEIPEEWISKLQVGIVAVSTSKEEFNPRFSKLQLLK